MNPSAFILPLPNSLIRWELQVSANIYLRKRPQIQILFILSLTRSTARERKTGVLLTEAHNMLKVAAKDKYLQIYLRWWLNMIRFTISSIKNVN